MYPFLFTIDSFFVPSYYVFLVIGAVVGVGVVTQEAKRLGFPGRQIVAFVLGIIPFAYLMGLVNGWLFTERALQVLREFRIFTSGGLVSFGAILGSLFMAGVLARHFKQSTPKVLDLIVPAWPLVLGFLRIGCLLNGCCYGLETDGFLGVVLPGRLGAWESRYPTQIMLSVFNFALFACLWPRRKHTSFDGELTLTYLMLYSLGRLAIDAFRDLPRVLGPFSPHQLAAIAIFILSAGIFIKVKRSPEGG